MSGTPITIWRNNNGFGEYSGTGVLDIMDTTGAFLVDTVANNIVDTGIAFTDKPKTIWSENDGI